ncbi:MAG: GerAB/ArcD/ProY family transporter [Clostridiales bacterium]|nr:GerAB/ArcD/ProY family transporter [Clostridiales bacterium]
MAQSNVNEKQINSTAQSDKEAQKTPGKTTETKQSTSKQLIVVVFILSLATKLYLLPIYLIQMTGRDAYIALSIEVAFDLIALGLLLAAIMLAGDKSFFELLEEVIGKVGAKIFVAFVALFLFFKLNISAAETSTFYSDNVFADFDAPFMIIVLLIFLGSVANHTLRSLCRINELMAPIVALGIVMLIAIVIATGFDFANIFPAMRNGLDFRRAMMRNAAWIGDFTPLVLFIGRTKTKKHTAVFAAASGTVGSAVVVFFGIVLCAAFGNIKNFADSCTNISNILQFSIGNVYGRIDLLSSILWSVSAFIETALFFYATCRCVEYVIGRNIHFWVGLSLCVILYFLQVFAMTDPTIFSTVASCIPTAVMTPVFAILIPALALISAIVVRKRDKKQSEQGSENEAEK